MRVGIHKPNLTTSLYEAIGGRLRNPAGRCSSGKGTGPTDQRQKASYSIGVRPSPLRGPSLCESYTWTEKMTGISFSVGRPHKVPVHEA